MNNLNLKQETGIIKTKMMTDYSLRDMETKAERNAAFAGPVQARDFLGQFICRIRMISRWKEYTEHSTTFTLTDENGVEIKGPARELLFIKSVIPAPDNPIGTGEDWVKITKLKLPNDKSQDFLMRVQPSSNPGSKTKPTAHFYSNSSFVEIRGLVENCKVKIKIESTKLRPNIGREAGFLQSIRNTGIAIFGKLGFSALHWKDLLNGCWDAASD